MTAPLDQQAMREKHPKREYSGRYWCDRFIQALDALERAERVVEAAREALESKVDLGNWALRDVEELTRALAVHDAEVGR